MIKVCHVTSAHSSDDTRVFHKECVSLAAVYDVTLVAPGESREDRGVHVVGMGQKPEGTLRRLRSGFPKQVCARALELDAEIYHLHDPELLPFALTFKRRGKKVVFDSHEFYARLMEEKAFLPSYLRKTAGKLYESYETHVLRRIDAVVTPCTLMGENVFAGRAKKTVFVDNLPMADRFAEQPDVAAAPEDTVGYVGGISSTRGVESMLAAAYKAGVRLRLAGPVWPPYLEELKQKKEFACADYIGKIPYAEVPAFCRTVRVGMCTLLNVNQYALLDNLPTKVYEYLGCGLPVIFSDTAAARRFVDEYDCGICVDPQDTDAMASAMRMLLDDPEKARRMGENGRRAVMEKFNWKTQEENLLNLYRELCER